MDIYIYIYIYSVTPYKVITLALMLGLSSAFGRLQVSHKNLTYMIDVVQSRAVHKAHDPKYSLAVLMYPSIACSIVHEARNSQRNRSL